MKTWLTVLIVFSFTSVGVVVAKQDFSPNARVVSQKDQLTLGDQSNKPVDVLTTKNIRSELMNDDSLSMKAKNIMIVTINNGVTLKGNVESSRERERILKHAYITAPKHKIYNQITVVK